MAREGGLERSGSRAVPVALFSISVVALAAWYAGRFPAASVDIAAACVGLAGCVAGIGLLRADRPVPALGRMGLAWAVFVGVAVSSMLVSGRVWAAFVGESESMLGVAVLASVTLVLAASVIHGEHVRSLLLRYGLWILLLQSLLALAQLVSGSGSFVRGTLPNSTYFGQALILLLPWTLTPRWEGAAWERRLRVAVVLLALGMLAGTGSRVAAVAGGVWALWLFSRAVSLPRRRRAIVLAGVVAIMGTAGMLFASGELLGTLDASSLGERPQMWQTSLRAVQERPVIGWGPDGYLAGGTAVLRPGPDSLAREHTLHQGKADPHSLPIWIAVSTGLVGLAAFIWFARETVVVWLRQRDCPAGAPGIWATIGCTVVFLTAPAALQVLPLFALVFGASLTCGGTRTGLEEPRGAMPLRLRVTVVFLTIAAAMLTVNASTRSILEHRSPSYSPRIAPFAQTASRAWFLDAHLAFLSSRHWTYAVLDDPTLGRRRPDLSAIERAVWLDRHHPVYPLDHARILYFYDEPTESIEAAFSEAFERYPAYPMARAEYGAYLAQMGRFEEAREQIRIARLSGDDNPELLATIEYAESIIDDSAK